MVSFGWPIRRIRVVVTHLPSKQVTAGSNPVCASIGSQPTLIARPYSAEKWFPVGRGQTSNHETFG